MSQDNIGQSGSVCKAGSDFRAAEGSKNAPPGAPLGNYGKSHSAPIRIKDLGRCDPETGELVQTGRDPSLARLERWALLSVSRELLPHSQTAKCYRVRRAEHVTVLHSSGAASGHLAGLCTCHSVWACPVCASKISERRREDLQAALDAARAQGLHAYLLTLTHPHTRADSLPDLLRGEQDALARVLKVRATQGILARIGRVGQVRAWEVTHGRKRAVSHGWHPHFHLLLFCTVSLSAADRREVQGALYAQWAKACERAGLDRPREGYGCRLDGGERAADYVTKWGQEEAAWGFASELTKGHIKRAGEHGETPFDLLRALLVDEGDRQAAWLYREYAGAYRGKRQLVWSRGLRERLGLDAEATDAEIAAEQREDAAEVARLDAADWRAVVRFAAQGELCELACHGADTVARFIIGLRARSVR